MRTRLETCNKNKTLLKNTFDKVTNPVMTGFLKEEPLEPDDPDEPGPSKQYDQVTLPVALDLCLRTAMIEWYCVLPARVFPPVVRVACDDPAATETNSGDFTAL